MTNIEIFVHLGAEERLKTYDFWKLGNKNKILKLNGDTGWCPLSP